MLTVTKSALNVLEKYMKENDVKSIDVVFSGYG